MAGSTLTVRSQRVVLPEGTQPATVGIRAGVIEGVWTEDGPPVDLHFGESVVMPGLVDTHVHVNEPGRTEWEGFRSATAAAAAGGTTTIIDMPLNSIPPTTDAVALDIKRRAAAGSCWVDVGFWGGLIPGNLGHIRELVEEGVFGFKCFLADSGVPEFPPVTLDELSAAAHMTAEAGVPIVVHAEDPETISGPDAAFRALTPEARRSYEAYVASRPPEAEIVAVRRLASLASRTGAQLHVLHVSAAEALEPVRRARAGGALMTTETCPHYLTFEADGIPDGATFFKCAPPIRDGPNRSALWAGLADGSIDIVVSDHSPCTPDLKRSESGDFARAWGGIASLQLRLPAVWTEARSRGGTFEDLTRWMSSGPAELVGLNSKGRIGVGADADLVVWDPETPFVVQGENLLHRHETTPYAGRRLYGAVLRTFVAGRTVWDGSGLIGRPSGLLLERSG